MLVVSYAFCRVQAQQPVHKHYHLYKLVVKSYTAMYFSNHIKLMVKTYASEGLIWFVGAFMKNENDSPDYSVIYLDKGRVVYKCNLGELGKSSFD